MVDAATSLPSAIRSGDYGRTWLRPDVLGGLTVAAMLVPQAMAYAELAGLGPAIGFRAALVALPVYALIGTSRHLGVGPEPGTAVLAALAVAPLAAGDPGRYGQLMAMLAVLVGLFALVAGALRLGFIADLLSKPVLVGYITGVGVTLLASQLGPLSGISIEAGDVVPRFIEFARRVADVDPASIGLGLATLAVIMGLRRSAPAVPGALLGLVLAGVATALFGIDVSLVGDIDAALPTVEIPSVGFDDVRDLVAPAAGIVLIAYTDNILTARSIASKQGYRIDSNRELVAVGAINVASGAVGGFPISSSASRSVVPASLGTKSQASSLVTLVAVALLLSFARPLLAEIPRPALAAVVVAAAFAVIDVDGFRRLAAVSRAELALAVITFVAIITTDLLLGVLVALVASVLVALFRMSRPHDALLGQADGLGGWIDIADDRARPEPGLLVYRFDAPLFFGNADYYRRRVFEACEEAPGREAHVILDFEGIGSLDTTAADQLVELHGELLNEGIETAVARANKEVVAVMERSGLATVIGPSNIHATINAAVAAYRAGRVGTSDPIADDDHG